ncbi:MAG: DNA-3-methyladenine glycosylase family protein [Solirubrobacterales bacterium]
MEVLQVQVRPRFTVRLPRSGGGDGVMRFREGVLERLLHVGPCPVRVRAWQTRHEVLIRAERVEPRLAIHHGDGVDCRDAGREELELAIERMRFALHLDEDPTEFFRAFKRDPVIGATIHRRPWTRPRRHLWPWEALAWAITEQLIELRRAKAIQRRIVRRWGPRVAPRRRGDRPLLDVPSPALVSGRAPAELVGMDLTEARALALVRCAREVAAGRAEPSDPGDDRRLLAIREIGPWTIQCLGYKGRGDPDSLPAGDLAYVKLVGHLAGLGRRATVEEVEEFFAPYAPFRGLAGTFALAGHHKAAAQGPPLRLAPDRCADAA